MFASMILAVMKCCTVHREYFTKYNNVAIDLKIDWRLNLFQLVHQFIFERVCDKIAISK